MENNIVPEVASSSATQAADNVSFPSFTKLFNEAWEITKKQFWLIFGFILVMALLAGLAGGLTALLFVFVAATSNLWWLAAFGFIGAFFAGAYVGCAILAGEVYILKNRHSDPKFDDAFKYGFRLAPKMLGPAILVSLICFAGTMLFVIPGIIWGLMYGLTLFIVADQQIDGQEAMKKSVKYMDGGKASYFVRIFLLNLVIFGLSLALGAINAVPVLGPIVASLMQTAFGVFVAIFGYVIYENIKDIKEAGKKFASSNDMMWAILICVVQVLVIIIIVAVVGFAAIVGTLALSKTENTTVKQNVMQLSLKANFYSLSNGENDYKGFNCNIDQTTQKICQAVKDKTQKDPIINVSEDGKSFCIEADSFCIDNEKGKGKGFCNNIKCQTENVIPGDYGANIQRYFEDFIK